MHASSIAGTENAFSLLRRLAQPRGQTEECEFCSVTLHSQHRHLFEPATRKIICVCDPCALRFENVVGRWQLIPRDVRSLTGFSMSDADWESLALPIQLAFIFQSSAANRVVAMYPSPAGATESLLPLTNWQSLTAANPVLADLKPDVEALLLNRLGTAREYYLGPIDLWFELVGLIRLHWRGFSGGDNAWREIEAFFSRVRACALGSAVPEVAHA